MKELLQVWGRVAGKTYSAVGRAEHVPSAPIPKEKTPAKRKRRIVTVFVAGILGLCMGLYIFFANPYNSIFDWKVTLGAGGEIFEMWRKPAVDLYVQVYLFNVTNSEAFVAGREHLKVEEVGPYVYKELLEHGNVTFNENGTLSSIPLHPLQWQAEMSHPRTQEDLLVLPNIAMLAIGHVGADSNPFSRMAINALLRSTASRPLVKMTAREFMFGHSSPLVTLGNSLLPGWIKFDKLGLIDRMYDFETDFETMYTGEGAPELSGLLDTWRGSRHLPQWEGECGNIHKASDGAKFHGDLTPDQEVLFYRKSLCRAAPMVKTGEGWVDGLWGYRYSFHNNTLDNGAREEKNKCFCRKGHCLAEGLIDVTDCYYGFPIALSYPHFLDGASSLGRGIEGLSADPELHGSSIWLQPKSGLPLSVAARFQINMALLYDMSSMHMMKSFSKMTMPLLWFEFRMFGLPEQMGTLFRLYLNILPIVQAILMWILLLVAPLLLLLGGVLTWRGRDKASPRTSYNPKRRGSRFTNSIRKMSMDIEAKLQGVYGPCEIPMDGNESSSPFLHAVDLNTSDSDETEAHISEERRPSIIKLQADKIKDLGISFSNRIQGNLGGMAKNIKSFTNILSQQQGSSNESNDDANHNDGFNSESCQSGSEEDGAGEDLSTKAEISDEDEECDLEIVDDGSEFDAAFDAHRRRQSVEFAKMEKKMTQLETEHHFSEEETKDMLSKLPYLPEDSV